ncbi:MAG TPA: hypothetical protein VL485_00040 [Ktedonobacteraceae bacterium]|nr:hypothetical protein [Ktedonobacteraceae bacterium]
MELERKSVAVPHRPSHPYTCSRSACGGEMAGGGGRHSTWRPYWARWWSIRMGESPYLRDLGRNSARDTTLQEEHPV